MDQAVASSIHEESRKSHLAFRTISEVAQEIDVPQHVLRFWESRFSQIKPLKRGGGRRYYRPEDVELLRCIKNYLYKQGYTIKGVQRILKESRRVLEQPAAYEYRDDGQAPQPVDARPEDYVQDFAESFTNATAPEEVALPSQADALARSLEAVTTLREEIENPTQPMRVEAAEMSVAASFPLQEVGPTSPLTSRESEAMKAELRDILGELVELRGLLQSAS